LTVAHVGTQALSTPSTTGSAQWMYQHGTGISDAGALFSVVATDSAGNVVSTPGTYGTYSADSATLTTTVQAISVNTRSTTASASSTSRYNYGSWTCGSDAGKANVKIKLTLTATGDVISSDAFEARCAGSPYTYTASLDKASYTQGDIATATVKFLDSKGNPSNSVATPGTGTWTLPYMTGVSFTLPTTTSTGVTKADGTLTYTFTVGTSGSAVTAGTYTGIVEYASLAVSAKSTPTYKIGTGSTDVTFTEVLKSVVALIASINKQIQALQKLILRR
jgi:hypothetical protein